ncbi:DNA repair protein RadA [Thermosipho ferrireducens]|uniref:DNA repair protein RadA n=1 Tax=Thermosipho ferrireducens TaxID=2571116 RepID=A0ABX7S6B6_9BACT|nr:DNA repair protein RadA [Thermosipho ferrireducens]QTA38124.1 DNA repair protein RadA [Thermosipho ferrireducens]
MSKTKIIYVCDNCGYESPKWFGKCPVCNEWNTAKELKLSNINKAGEESSRFFLLEEISEVEMFERLITRYSEINNLFGGGVVPGQVILLGGEPGVGKSTLALQLCYELSRYGKVAYITGEESAMQIALRAKRLKIENSGIYLSTENNIESVLTNLRKQELTFVVFDSIQTLYSNKVDSASGGVLQVRTVVDEVRKFSKDTGIASLLIAHVTKGGNIAGPKLVEHIVDTVIYFEGEKSTDLRVLRVLKNRFGPSGEIAIFSMSESGLKELKERIFIEESPMPGNTITSLYEGSRPFLVQIQSLVSRDKIATARRISHGIDVRKIIIMSAVISKHLNLPVESHDVYANVSGGLKITDSACDLAIAASILSSFLNKYIGKFVIIGEVGLDGSIRNVHNIKKRIENAIRSGYDKFIIPKKANVPGSESVIKLGNLKELLNYMIDL